MNNFDQKFNESQPIPNLNQQFTLPAGEQTFDQYQANLMAGQPSDISPEMLNQFMEFQKSKQMTDTDDFCSPEVVDKKPNARKRSTAPKRDKHGLSGAYGNKKRKVTPGRVFGGKKVSGLARMSEAEIINNPDMSLSKLRESQMN